jgi:hypothetical protein
MRYRRGGQPTAVVNRPVTGLTLSRRAASSRPAADRSTPSAPSVQRRHVRWQARIRLDGTGGRQATITGTPRGPMPSVRALRQWDATADTDFQT